jgi:hypothetical protein
MPLCRSSSPHCASRTQPLGWAQLATCALFTALAHHTQQMLFSSATHSRPPLRALQSHSCRYAASSLRTSAKPQRKTSAARHSRRPPRLAAQRLKAEAPAPMDETLLAAIAARMPVVSSGAHKPNHPPPPCGVESSAGAAATMAAPWRGRDALRDRDGRCGSPC